MYFPHLINIFTGFILVIVIPMSVVSRHLCHNFTLYSIHPVYFPHISFGANDAVGLHVPNAALMRQLVGLNRHRDEIIGSLGGLMSFRQTDQDLWLP